MGIMIQGIMTLGKMARGMMTLCIMTLSIMTFEITALINGTVRLKNVNSCLITNIYSYL
jgi:hypothetical protein